MNRTRMLLCLPALLAVALTVSPVRADPELPKSEAQEILKLLREMQEDNARLRREFTRMQQENDTRQSRDDNRDSNLEKRLQIIENRLAEIERAGKARISNYPPDQSAPSAEQLRELRAKIDELNSKLRTSSSFTPSEAVIPPAPPVLAMGVLRLQNLSLNTSLVRVNGVTYTVFPGETSIRVPAGTFTYEVLADSRGFAHAQQLRELSANDRITVTIYP